jgi:putative phosphoesterase
MKSYLVFSDIHNDPVSLMKLRGIAKEHDGVIFAGDGLSLAKEIQKEPLFAVGGNCDFGGDIEGILKIDGVRILLTHGHKYGVKSSLLSLSYRASELMCSVAIFGHTHEPFCAYEGNVMMLNPGACSGYGQKTYGILYIRDGKPDADVFKL